MQAIILAAGAGRRMGCNKALARWGEGQGAPTFLARIVASCVAARCHPVIVVLGAQAWGVREAHPMLAVEWVENTNWRETGMLESALLGFAASRSDAPFLVWPVDCPLVRPDTLLALGAALAAEPDASSGACVPCCQGRRGHPVLLGAAFARALQDRAYTTLRDALAAREAQVASLHTLDVHVLDNLNAPSAAKLDASA